VRDLGGAEKRREEIGRDLDAAEPRGLVGRLPQLSLVSFLWLPFERNTVIEDIDWRGRRHAFGSVFRLSEELRAVRSAIADSDPGCREISADGPAEVQPLRAALAGQRIDRAFAPSRSSDGCRRGVALRSRPTNASRAKRPGPTVSNYA